jgi:hypothetical protein
MREPHTSHAKISNRSRFVRDTIDGENTKAISAIAGCLTMAMA